MLLKNKNAIIYGAAGSLGRSVALAFAKQGARVFLTGHKYDPLKKLMHEIIMKNGNAEAAIVDALNENQVYEFVNSLEDCGITIDISMNAIGIQDVQGMALMDMELHDFMRPVRVAMETQFITATAAGKVMKKQGSGTIISLTATPGGIGYSNVGGFGPACCAIEGFMINLASELGPSGVRAVNIRSAGSPDSRVFQEAVAEGGDKGQEFVEKLKNDTMLKKLPMMGDVANTAVFLASDMASKITGCTIDVTAGTTSALNYKVTPITFPKGVS